MKKAIKFDSFALKNTRYDFIINHNFYWNFQLFLMQEINFEKFKLNCTFGILIILIVWLYGG